MNYVYFVSYSHSMGGFGMIEVFRDKPIKTYDDVLSLREVIKDKNGLDVIIINWKELEQKY